MKIGLYFGTFNPIHIGHLIIANHLAEYSDLDQIWMVVTPQNPFKKKSTLLEDYHRLQMVHLATENFPKIKPSDVEFKLPKPNYTIHTLAHLQDKHPDYEFSLIMGQDNLKSLQKWKNYQAILSHHTIYVYPRLDPKDKKEETTAPENEKLELSNHPKVHLIAAPIVEIAATFIRENIKKSKNVRPLLPNKVWEYIDHNNFYKK